MTKTQHSDAVELMHSDSVAFSSIYVACFTVLLLIALLATVVAVPWRTWLPGAESAKSMIGGVRSAVYTLMSHLI
jgi:formate hydrogenlyase subunit 3/multisubunit Na+/H+ antiporter MnhD subunit